MSEMKVVPVMPTQEMIDAWRTQTHQGRSLETAYVAMIAAAPAQPVARMEWRIQVAGPAGYVRFENFKGETLDDACGDALKQGYICCQDEDGEPVVARPSEPQEAVPAGDISMPPQLPKRDAYSREEMYTYAQAAAVLTMRLHRDRRAGNAAAVHADLDFDPSEKYVVADMANVGYAFMTYLEQNLPDASWDQSPAEVLTAIIDERDEALKGTPTAAVPAPWWPDESQRAAMWSGLSFRMHGLTEGDFAEICATIKHVIDSKQSAAAVPAAQPARETFQARVAPWLQECFGAMIAGDREERNHRFLEESLELVQACGCSASEAHQLVDYVFGRAVGEPIQEVGGVMVTLAALCLANGMDMHLAGWTELARISGPNTIARIRAKQAAKPKHSPLPQAGQLSANSGEVDAALEAIRKVVCKLPRYSFHMDSRSNIRRAEDTSGNWVEFDAVHGLFDPIAGMGKGDQR